MIEKITQIRLTTHDISKLKDAFVEYFTEDDSLWVFGSRVDLNKKGGDIDLYIETTIEDYDIAIDKKLAFSSKLKRLIGDQKIDIILNHIHSSYELPIYQVPKSQGVKIQ
jgi:hypothetical protein